MYSLELLSKLFNQSELISEVLSLPTIKFKGFEATNIVCLLKQYLLYFKDMLLILYGMLCSQFQCSYCISRWFGRSRPMYQR